jgi:hypothetical protein
MSLRTRLVAAAALALTAALAPSAHALTPAAGCSLYAAASGGSDAASGSAAAPFKTAQKLADTLAAGQTGCVAAGTYTGGLRVAKGGTGDAERLTIQSYPGQRAKIVGQVYIVQTANFVTVQNLELDGTNSLGKPSPMVNGDDSLFTGNNVHSDVDSCFVLGDLVYGVADRTVIRGNRIHDCGVDGTNMDHGVYIRQANDTKVLGNVIHDNPDRGVQLFMNGDRSVVQGNLIDRNGEGVMFSGDSDEASDDNLVTGNIITNSRLRTDVEYYWMPGMVGLGNVLSANCIHGGVQGALKAGMTGVTVTGDNLFSNPLLLLSKQGVYSLSAKTPCPVALPVLPSTTK